jgi:cytochrome b561
MQNACAAVWILSSKRQLVTETREHHGQTTTLWNNREGISLADRGAARRAIPARVVHARDSSRDEASDALTFHISFGITILALIVLRLLWRITHPVAPESSLPAWQQLMSEAVHWLLYALVLTTTMSGWLLASEHGWSISLFFAAPLPMLTSEGSLLAKSIGKWHGAMEWALLSLVGAHVAAAMAHTFIFRDRIMQRMLPTNPMIVDTNSQSRKAWR